MIFGDLYKTIVYFTGFLINFYLLLLKFLYSKMYSLWCTELYEFWQIQSIVYLLQSRYRTDSSLQKIPLHCLFAVLNKICTKSTLSSFALTCHLSHGISCLTWKWLNSCVNRNSHENLLKHRLWAPTARGQDAEAWVEWLWYRSPPTTCDVVTRRTATILHLSSTHALCNVTLQLIPWSGGVYFPIPRIQTGPRFFQ